MIAEMVVAVADRDVEGNTPKEFFQIDFNVGAVLNDEFGNIKIPVTALRTLAVL